MDSTSHLSLALPATDSSISSSASPPDVPTDLDRGQCTKTPSILLRDCVTNAIQVDNPSPSTSAPLHSSGKSYPNTDYINCQSFFYVKSRKFLATLTSISEPKSFKEALQDAGW